MRELFQLLDYRAEVSGAKVAFDDGLASLTYGSLSRRIAGVARELRDLPSSPTVIGLLGGNRVDTVVGQLAAWHADKVAVPLPPFFSVPQLRHVVQDAGVTHVSCTPDMVARARLLGVSFAPISHRQEPFLPSSGEGAGQIIYTSGSTGRPKGVRLSARQLMWSAAALARATAADERDSYLSLLPLSILLETICAVMVPVLAGATVRIEPSFAEGFGEADSCDIAALAAAHRPSCMVLVPQLLSLWVAQLSRTSARAPDSLRFVAVGGAPVPPGLAQRAWHAGIPVCEGYGLSECGSVVALNRPGARKAGTVGRPLPGIDVGVDRGEIVVRTPSLMDGYLHGDPVAGVWRTGDVGEIDADGFLAVRGRVDNLVVTSLGRNISPEWVESAIAGDSRLVQCIVVKGNGGQLRAILVPTAASKPWFECASTTQIQALIFECCRDLPAYAIPRDHFVAFADDLQRFGILTRDGRIQRSLLGDYADMFGAAGAVRPARGSVRV
jgi:long-subunit acyl-CoA synthetase (AMP-forming)